MCEGEGAWIGGGGVGVGFSWEGGTFVEDHPASNSRINYRVCEGGWGAGCSAAASGSLCRCV